MCEKKSRDTRSFIESGQRRWAIWPAHSHLKHSKKWALGGGAVWFGGLVWFFCILFFFFNLKCLGCCEVLHLNQRGLSCFCRNVKPETVGETSPHTPSVNIEQVAT